MPKIAEEKVVFHDEPVAARVYSCGRYPAHFHTGALELLFVLDGRVTLKQGHQLAHLSRGDVYSIDEDDIHCLFTDECEGEGESENAILSLYLDLKHLSEPFEKLRYIYFACESPYLLEHQRGAMSDVVDLILALALALYGGAGGAGGAGGTGKASTQQAADRLMETLLEHFNWFACVADPEALSDYYRMRYQQIMAYCQQHYAEKITLKTLAAELHVNPGYLSHFMESGNFKGFTAMLSNIRCYPAEKLLLTTDLSVAEISARCGFSDVKYLYASFREWFGITPKAHRDFFAAYMAQPFAWQEFPRARALRLLQENLAEHHTRKLLLTV